MQILSAFEDTSAQKQFPSLNSDLSVDVTVIGAGITGVTAAFLLASQGKSVALVEAHQIAKGATGNSTGNLYATVGNKGLQGIVSKFDKDLMKDVVSARAHAVDFIEQRVHEFGIDCDFKRISWHLFTGTDKKKSYVEKEEEAAKDAGLSISGEIPFPLPIEHGFSVSNQAQFNPYSYTVGLAANIRGNSTICEHTKVTAIEEEDGRCIVKTSGGTITSRFVVMATHTPKGVYQVHSMMSAHREYAVAATLRGNYPPDGTFWDERESEHYSLRTYESEKGKVLMVLGQTHIVGQEEDNSKCFEKLESFLKDNFDVDQVQYRWGAQQYKPADTLPYIGRTSDDSNIFIATGFAADGLTYGTLAAILISDEIAGHENKWAKIFDPRRHTPIASAGEVIKEGLNVAMQYIKDLPFIGEVSDFDDVDRGQGKVVEVDGEKYGAYRDDNGTLHVVSAVCTHMKCIVNWNVSEKTWDCPCHGSRFGCHGEVIEGPAISDLPKFKKD